MNPKKILFPQAVRGCIHVPARDTKSEFPATILTSTQMRKTACRPLRGDPRCTDLLQF